MRGASCLLIEQGDGLPDHPRATAINSRSMEFMRRWGIAGAVHAAGTPDDFPHAALYCTSLAGHQIARIERPTHGGRQPIAQSPERPQRCNQIFLDPILAELARSFETVILYQRCRLEAVTEAVDHVIATVHDRANDRRFQIAARYVIDCSGGRSVIRPALGVDMHGSDYLGYFLSIFVRAPELWTHHAMGKAALINFVDARGMWSNLISLDGRELYRFAVIGKAYYDDPQGVDAEELLQSAFGKDLPHEILSISAMVGAQRRSRHLSARPHILRRRCGPSQSSGRRTRPQYRSRRRCRSWLETFSDARRLGRWRPARQL